MKNSSDLIYTEEQYPKKEKGRWGKNIRENYNALLKL